jgi:hypothetical protein
MSIDLGIVFILTFSLSFLILISLLIIDGKETKPGKFLWSLLAVVLILVLTAVYKLLSFYY